MHLRASFVLLISLALCSLPAFAGPAQPHVKPKPAVVVEAAVTGLVIDTRGLNYEPRMSPHLYDDSAHNLLEGMTFDPEKVTSDGFARWVRVFNVQDANPRVGKRPLILKPLRVDSGDRLVFSAQDATALKAANAKDHFIDQMRILIVY